VSGDGKPIAPTGPAISGSRADRRRCR
jgi:hypothetical protein